MNQALSLLLKRHSDVCSASSNVIEWSAPVPVFGDPVKARVATLGLNPSNREFVDQNGTELSGKYRRFHTLTSLGLQRWTDATSKHVSMLEETCSIYFTGNPYDLWFRALDRVIASTGASYYSRSACHLDLIPYATACKWVALRPIERSRLMEMSAEALALLLLQSKISVLILNGRTVAESLQRMTDISLSAMEMKDWTLPRANGEGVKGISYTGTLTQVLGRPLKRKVHVLGFNHNIQSSFGVTGAVKRSISDWLERRTKESI